MAKHKMNGVQHAQVPIGTQYPARQSAVEYLLSCPVGGGRSGWRWFRLHNGDLILGFYPQGDEGYTATEAVWSDDWQLSRELGREVTILADPEDLEFFS